MAVVGARLVGDSATAWRVGGAVVNGNKVSLDVADWKRSGGKWLPLTTPGKLPRRIFANVLHDTASKRLLVWGGATQAGLSDLISTVIEVAAPGGEQLDLSTGKWSALSKDALSALPTLAVDAALALGPGPNDVWVFGIAPMQSKSQLWRIDMKPPLSKQLIWSQTGGNPPVRRGSVLTWDPILKRLLLLTIDGSLQVWSWDPATGGNWQKLGTGINLAQGQVRLFGEPILADSLAVVSHPIGGQKAGAWKAKFSGKATLTPWSGSVPAWWGPLESLWLAKEGRVLISPGSDAAGLLRPGIENWRRVCSKKSP